ncbi:hypothetical protein BDZ45DRAFT_754014 [Acephala macrosclerotiorum]|nr:hypothetical protein BDZ45DRAFT_754014 [Acephala macrosclerotiorum]
MRTTFIWTNFILRCPCNELRFFISILHKLSAESSTRPVLVSAASQQGTLTTNVTPAQSFWLIQTFAHIRSTESNIEPATTMENATPPTWTETEILARIFVLFSKLPAEVQLNVWKCAAELEPRDIHVAFAKKTIDRVGVGYLKAITPPPVILHTCHDDRVAGLKTHTTTAFKHMGKDGQNMIYSTPELDTIIIHLSERTADLINPYGALGTTTSPWQDSTHEMWYLRFGKHLAYDHLKTKEGLCFIVFPIQSKQFESNQISHLTQALRRVGNDCLVKWNLKWAFKGWQPFFFSLVVAVEHMSSCRFLYWSHLNGGNEFLVNRIRRIDKSTGTRSRDTDRLRSISMPADVLT